jgi:hypothetical protein
MRPSNLLLVGSITVFIVTVFLVLMRRRQRNASTIGDRLFALANERSDYIIAVGIPPSDPNRWSEVTAVTNSTVATSDARQIPLDEITHFVVSYPNGQLVDFESSKPELSIGITGITTAAHPDTDLLTVDDLMDGNQYVVMSYGPSTSRPNDPNHYSTSLTNISDHKIRVLQFGGYTPAKNGWKLDNATSAFYSPDEFVNWYGLGEAEWITPGQKVTDTNNYGGRPVLWAYYCETDDGTKFVAGKVLD